eukprot:s5_g6.t1
MTIPMVGWLRPPEAQTKAKKLYAILSQDVAADFGNGHISELNVHCTASAMAVAIFQLARALPVRCQWAAALRTWSLAVLGHLVPPGQTARHVRHARRVRRGVAVARFAV